MFGLNDIVLSNNCNANNESRSNIGDSFNSGGIFTHNSQESMTYMTGSSKFKVDEVEIFRVNTF
jgi:hypothetical protein